MLRIAIAMLVNDARRYLSIVFGLTFTSYSRAKQFTSDRKTLSLVLVKLQPGSQTRFRNWKLCGRTAHAVA